jgi:hypothetical protein
MRFSLMQQHAECCYIVRNKPYMLRVVVMNVDIMSVVAP